MDRKSSATKQEHLVLHLDRHEAVQPPSPAGPRKAKGSGSGGVRVGRAQAAPPPPPPGNGARIIAFPAQPADRTPAEEEARLVEMARHGDTEAFGQLVRQHERKIFRLALRITRNQEDAADAKQDAFMKAYTNLKMFRGDSRFPCWLTRIAVNEALSKLRTRLWNRHVSLDDGELAEPRAHHFLDNPEHLYARIQMQEILAEAIEELPPALKMVLRLWCVDDCTIEQIARRADLSVPAVKSRLLRARLKLRHRLSKHKHPSTTGQRVPVEATWTAC